MSGEEVNIELECGHQFHETCLREWLSLEKHCPICKKDIDP